MPERICSIFIVTSSTVSEGEPLVPEKLETVAEQRKFRHTIQLTTRHDTTTIAATIQRERVVTWQTTVTWLVPRRLTRYNFNFVKVTIRINHNVTNLIRRKAKQLN